LRRVERALLQEEVSRLGDPRRLRQHLRQCEVEIRIGVGELRRHGVRAEPGRDAFLGDDRAQRGQLGLAVEPVARLRLESRSAGAQHPLAVAVHGRSQLALAGRSGGTNRREDPAAGCVQLLVAGASRA